MSRVPVLILVLAVSLAWPASCQPLPVLLPVTKDPATSLYTIPFYNGTKLVVDIAGPLVWSTCDIHQWPRQYWCNTDICRLANAYPVQGCGTYGCGGDPRTPWRCTAYPYNPITGTCAGGSLVWGTLFGAKTTDGRKPVSQVSVEADLVCGTTQMIAGASGVAGLAGSGLALPAQVASSQKVAKKFLLCLPRRDSNGNGVVIFGGGPFHLPAVPEEDYTEWLEYTPLVSKNDSPAYYVTVNYIALDDSMVPLPPLALATGGAVLRTTVPYTELRADVYRPFVDAFGKAMAARKSSARVVKPVPPFGLCYDAGTLGNTHYGYAVPRVTLALDGGKNWTMVGVNSMVVVESTTACLAFVEMKDGDDKAPALIVGGFQMENFVLQFDLETNRFGFLKLPFYTQCGSFDFTGSKVFFLDD